MLRKTKFVSFNVIMSSCVGCQGSLTCSSGPGLLKHEAEDVHSRCSPLVILSSFPFVFSSITNHLSLEVTLGCVGSAIIDGAVPLFILTGPISRGGVHCGLLCPRVLADASAV